MIDFDIKESNSIKSIALKGNRNINVTSKCINGKMLMFAKRSLKSFVYDTIDVFWYPSEEVKMIYDKDDIISVIYTLIWPIRTIVRVFSISSLKRNVTSKRVSRES